MIELLSPVGDFECLKAAVQNGADAVYFGTNMFSARAFATNFDLEELKKAINYAKLRGVKTNLTLNTLIKNSEFDNAISIVQKAYELGIDAIIVQDLGLASILIKNFPNLDIHASTQMTTHNLEGILELEKLGFKRAVLSRELSISEISYICKNSNIEIECFIHGALCISYSGQCLFSSMIGGRSGNRGKCAQTCRLPYELLQNDIKIDNGYLLSTRDLCSLEYLPELIKAGVKCFKIEGRMKSPEYVATVTRIYRKYIDMILNEKTFIIDEQDKKDLLQVFNRGGFSSGHLSDTYNNKLVFKEKQNNMGIYLGTIDKFNKNKGLITLKLNDTINIGDSISFENENSKYTISELMQNNQNIKQGNINDIVTLGRMKGNIKTRDKVYKISNKLLSSNAINSFSKEYKKLKLKCVISFVKNKPIHITTTCLEHNLTYDFIYDYIPLIAENAPTSREKIVSQFAKTTDTPFEFINIEINLDNNLFLPVSILNDIRRTILNTIESIIIKSFKRIYNNNLNYEISNYKPYDLKSTNKYKISLLLNNLNINFDYTKIKKVDNIYIPLKYFSIKEYHKLICDISNISNLYIYLPTIIRKNYLNNVKNIINKTLESINISGFVISNLSQIEILKELNICNNRFDLIGNYTLNVFNNFTKQKFKDLNLSTITISPELDKSSILELCNTTNINNELIVYGNIPVMTLNYCFLGKSNNCFNDCKKQCLTDGELKYYLKDRLGFKFRFIPNNYQTITTIYNSKITSIAPYDFINCSYRIDILDEDIDSINSIIDVVKSGNRLEGKNYTNGNLNREI